MAILQKLTYQAWNGQERVLDFLGKIATTREGVHTTVLTGHNGSHKSTILQELVAALTIPNHKSTLTYNSDAVPTTGTLPVICASGSVADRFPPKESGGRRTEFDVPNYVYIGQRIGANLLSKKLPLETAVAFALNATVRDRFLWPFYEKEALNKSPLQIRIPPTVQFGLPTCRLCARPRRLHRELLVY